jgi:hypothetical protein
MEDLVKDVDHEIKEYRTRLRAQGTTSRER